MLSKLNNQKGFTIIEMIAVMVIIGILASVGLVKYERFSSSAINADFLLAVRELNVRESLTYFNARLADAYIDDEALFPGISYDLGAARWSGSGPARTGGQLRIQGAIAVLSRAESSRAGPAQWTK